MFQNVSVVNQSPVHIFSHPETTAGYIYGAVWWIRCRVLQDSCLGCLAIEDQPKMVDPKQNLKHSETLSCEADCPNLPTSQPPNLPTYATACVGNVVLMIQAHNMDGKNQTLD